MVIDTIRLHNYPESTLERVDVPGKQHEQDRIYVWTKKPGEYEVYWMQDADCEKDDEVVASVNQYSVDPQSAAPVGSSSGTGVGAGAMDTDNADGASHVSVVPLSYKRGHVHDRLFRQDARSPPLTIYPPSWQVGVLAHHQLTRLRMHHLTRLHLHNRLNPRQQHRRPTGWTGHLRRNALVSLPRQCHDT
jgi:hypothetical protein